MIRHALWPAMLSADGGALLGALPRVTEGRVALRWCVPCPCRWSRSRLAVACVDLLLLPVSLCDDDGDACGATR